MSKVNKVVGYVVASLIQSYKIATNNNNINCASSEIVSNRLILLRRER